MTHFIELTTTCGYKFLANVSLIQCLINEKGDKRNENTYIVGLDNNGGFYIQDSYLDIMRALSNNLRPHEPIIRL
jgi:hypothetical protein